MEWVRLAQNLSNQKWKTRSGSPAAIKLWMALSTGLAHICLNSMNSIQRIDMAMIVALASSRCS